MHFMGMGEARKAVSEEESGGKGLMSEVCDVTEMVERAREEDGTEGNNKEMTSATAEELEMMEGRGVRSET